MEASALAAPSLDEVRLRNLEKAQNTRMGRAALKRRLKAGELTLEAALEEPAAAGMEMADLLRAAPRWGRKRARSFLLDLRYRKIMLVSENRRVGSLTERERKVLAEALAAR